MKLAPEVIRPTSSVGSRYVAVPSKAILVASSSPQTDGDCRAQQLLVYGKSISSRPEIAACHVRVPLVASSIYLDFAIAASEEQTDVFTVPALTTAHHLGNRHSLSFPPPPAQAMHHRCPHSQPSPPDQALHRPQHPLSTVPAKLLAIHAHHPTHKTSSSPDHAHTSSSPADVLVSVHPI